ncbi:hypothetical protein LBMAG42_57130 [Deltaproteobacteria bacterium]|nr:hypothetical protein LBMAG42_57130 [Deltaproteobacteria bacterium]
MAEFRIWKNCDLVLEQARTSRRILVAAGPGMGKTTILEMVEQRLTDVRSGVADGLGIDPEKVSVVRCRRGLDLTHDPEILSLLAGFTPDRAILVDDIDVAYTREAERMAWHAHRHSGLVILPARTFEGVRPPKDEEQQDRLRFSTSVASSLNLQNFHRIRPAEASTDEILAALRAAAPAAPPELLRALARDTSPHPVVLDAIARVLLSQPPDLREAKHRLESDLWSRDGRRFAIALEWARLRHPGAPEALGDLFRPSSVPNAPDEAFRALAEVGLAWRPNGKGWQAATPALERLLGAAKIELLPDSERPDSQGIVRYIDGAGSVEVPLTGVLWALIRVIAGAGRTVTDGGLRAGPSAMPGRGSLDEAVAVQPARSRLVAKLSEWGLGGLVRYERLAGSRIDLVHARASTRRLRVTAG